MNDWSIACGWINIISHQHNNLYFRKTTHNNGFICYMLYMYKSGLHLRGEGAFSCVLCKIIVHTLDWPRATNNLSATNCIYCFIKRQFIPMRFTGNASVRNYKNVHYYINVNKIMRIAHTYTCMDVNTMAEWHCISC